MGERGK